MLADTARVTNVRIIIIIIIKYVVGAWTGKSDTGTGM